MNNSPFNSLLRKALAWRFEVADGVYFRGNQAALSLTDRTTIVFDFRDARFVHFGDLLFFIPLLLCLSQKFTVMILAHEPHKALLDFTLANLNGLIRIMEAPPAPLWNDETLPIVVITTTYGLPLAGYPRHFAVVGLGMPRANIHEPYPEFRAHSFLRFTDVNNFTAEHLLALIHEWRYDLKQRVEQNAQTLESELPDRTLWLAPYLSSGRFRDLFKVKQRYLASAAIERSKKLEATIILVGGKDDLLPPPMSDTDFIDMRGRNVVQMIGLAGSSRVLQGIGFDGFWMHVFDLLEKPFDTLFRGRYTKSARALHYNSVNLSFLRSATRNYL